jgi:hypothetical protein
LLRPNQPVPVARAPTLRVFDFALLRTRGASCLRVAGVSTLLFVALLLHQGGIQRLLPYEPEVDEDVFVGSAVRIAATGGLSPGWFGHPGSTTIYPLATWYYFTAGGPWRTDRAEPSAVAQGLRPIPSHYYLAGRQLSVLYSLGALLLTFLLGRALHGYGLGVAALWVAAVIPISVSHGEVVRSDSAATFYGMLSLWALQRTNARPSSKNYLLAGAAIGLATASRYFMIALLPAAAACVYLSARSSSAGTPPRRTLVLHLCSVLAGVAVAFAATTPFFFLDGEAVRQSLQREAETSHLGADGLGVAGNFVWYLSESFPSTLGWLTVAFSVVGASAALRTSAPTWVAMLAFFCTFLAGVSLSPLHWHRWTIPVVPVMVLFAARGILMAADKLEARFQWSATASRFVMVLIVAGVTAVPGYKLAMFQLQERDGGVRLAARSWVVEHLPAGSRIAEEYYAAALASTPFNLEVKLSLADGHSIDDYRAEGFNYLITSSAISQRYFVTDGRYEEQRAFYENLERELVLVWQGEWRRPGLWPRLPMVDDTCPCNLWPVEGPPVIKIFAVAAGQSTP